MGRGKLNMELISNEKSRMITYHKRKKGLTKKAQEFHILCDVDACVIIFGPKFNNRLTDIETWPTDRYETRRIINRYRSQGSDRKKNQDLSHFFVTRKKKVDDDIAKMRKACMEAKYPTWDNRINLLQLHELSVLASVLESKIEVATDRVLKMKSESNSYFVVDPKSGIDIRPNPVATTFTNALIQQNMELEVYKQPQVPFSACTSQFDHLHQSTSSSYHQMLPILNVSPINSSMLMTMMANGDDLSQSGGESSSKRACNYMVKEPAAWNFDTPTSHQYQISAGDMIPLNNNNNNNPRAHPAVSYYSLNRQQPLMLPYKQEAAVVMPNASNQQFLRIPSFSDFFDFNEFEILRDNNQI